MSQSQKRSQSQSQSSYGRKYKRTKIGLTPKTYTKKTTQKQEVKSKHEAFPETLIGTTSGLSSRIGKIALGDGAEDRDGKAIMVQGFDARVTLARNARVGVTTLGLNPSSFRVIFGIWKQAYESSSPSSNDVLSTPGGTVNLTAPIDAQMSANLRILSDEIHNLPINPIWQPTSATTGSWAYPSQFKIVQKRFTTKFMQEYFGPEDYKAGNWTLFFLCMADGNEMYAGLDTQTYFTDS